MLSKTKTILLGRLLFMEWATGGKWGAQQTSSPADQHFYPPAGINILIYFDKTLLVALFTLPRSLQLAT